MPAVSSTESVVCVTNPSAGVPRHGLRHTVGGKHHRAGSMLGGNLAQFLYEDSAKVLQSFDHVPVVHDLVADIDGRAIFLQRKNDDLDSPVDAGTEAARLAKADRQRRLG